ncbi:aspartate aminotransferase family protein [Salipaludibacillus neizhouensis]|uniref:Aspartate aminotransferase family protein n=1 Tax=Salipaludibacillus neizhouensis TaxID=885475 RepID=A0A3A9K7E6_9BACI|nr:aspartate aminotransferase family protein [Salipaludibacillus neizhouensis]RKL68149.1 aspartate aminotransferase family protein [Salipaludibacillus neizhouensis]
MVIKQASLLEPVTHGSAQLNNQTFNHYFLNSTKESLDNYANAMGRAQDALVHQFSNNKKPYSGLSHEEFTGLFNETFEEILPDDESSMDTVLENIGKTILRHSIVVSNPTCLAHLHCPPLSSALAAEVMISGTNQSMDSWDQSASATVLEEKMVDWLSDLFFQRKRADGVFTSGGTQSNFMGLLLARDRYLKRTFNWNAQRNGLPIEANKLRILCSKDAHFTVRQSAFLLGLGEKAVIPVETDSHHRMCVDSLDRCLKEVRNQGLHPFALVATAGTTDFGSVDPLAEIATRAYQHQIWFHVDAAYGGALMLSESHKHQLTGINLADSISVDFHKLFYQPISCGAFLVKDKSNFDFIKLHADYLNPEDDEDTGIPNLVTKSIQTTRRFDALKLFVSFQALGKKTFADMIDYTIKLAQDTAIMIEKDSDFELMNHPEINAVVFRYRAESKEKINDTEELNRLNRLIRNKLLKQGHTVLARTRVNNSVYLKLTLLNPSTTVEDIQSILSQIKHLVETEQRI